ncbi:MAG TPA: hypothetical protein VGJ00_06075 [Rhabdochlamydiaceae bacterium]|jgi:hypothetical protein
MKCLRFFIFLLPLCFFSCTQKEEENLLEDQVAQAQEDEEWNSLNNAEEKNIPLTLLPEPQEVALNEWLE